MKLTKKQIKFLESLDQPIMVMTDGVRHSIFNTAQCDKCKVLSDPILMEDINDLCHCDDCAERHWTDNPPKKDKKGKMTPPKRWL